MDTAPFRPRLNPALRRLWRDTRTLQLGLDPCRALVVEGVDPAAIRFLMTLDGRRSEAELLADAAAEGIDVGVVVELLAGLRRGRALLDGTAEPVQQRLAPDVAARSLLPEAGQPVGVRAACSVVVHGGGRIAVPLAALLAAAGVGTIAVVEDGLVTPEACLPGGYGPADVRRTAAVAAREIVERTAPGVQVSAGPPRRLPDLTVLTSAYPVEEELRSSLQAAGLAHLVAGVRESAAIVGPLVLPGETSCLQCADLHRGDRDPDWPLLALQLTGEDRRRAPAAEVALALTAVGIAGMQALAFLDGREVATRGATLELAPPAWRIRRRPWPYHPRCDCRRDGPLQRAG